jgi:site-specific recombinase XerD
MIEDLQLRGLSKKTQDAYVRAVRQLAEHYGKSPDRISEEELRQYFLYLKNVKHASRSACTIALCGIKFFYQYTLKREWVTFELVRPPREKKLPVVLSVGQVRRILSCIHRQRYRVCLSTIYACGLRVQEGVHLQVRDIDSERMVVHVRHGKGAKDRYVPLPESTLKLLRQYWCTHRHALWLFPARTRAGVPPSTATTPMSVSGVQRAFKAALQESGVQKPATVHTLRHSYATHLLEAGVNLTRDGEALAAEAIDRVMTNRR